MRKQKTGTKPVASDLIQYYVIAASSDKRGVPTELDGLRVELKGFDKARVVGKVVFEDLVVNDKPLVVVDVKTSAFVRNVTIRR